VAKPPIPLDQTPVVFTLAGSGEMMSEECKKIVEKAGYPADCFGSYDDVKGKIDEAKANVKKYEDEQTKKGEPIDPTKPSARDRFLANCQSGHLSQNAIFQQPGQRGNSCANISPGGAGYHTRLAPCMPMPGPSGAPGTPHTLVTAEENENTRKLMGNEARPVPPKYIPMDHEQVAAGAQGSAQTAVRAGLGSAGANAPQEDLAKADALAAERRELRKQHKAAPKRSDERKQLKAKMEALKQKEDGHRRTAAAALQQQSAKEIAAAKGATGSDPASAADGKANDDLAKKAAECIETFRKNAMDAMRSKVKQDYSGPNLKKTTQTLKKNQKAAHERYDKALANAQSAKPEDKDAAQRELRAAARAKEEADKEVANIPCLAKQAKEIPETRPMPPMSGRVPVLPPRPPKTQPAAKPTQKTW
jgi:hypothetical protein